MVDVSAVAADLYGDAFESISRYVDILAGDGVTWGLIGPREIDRLWGRHILNSAAVSGVIPPGATLVDVGSGAGLPGIPLAILRPDLQITLLEPLLRRFDFLTHNVEKLGITNVEVVRGRAEDHRRRYEVVTARALAPLPKLVGWCAPLLAGNGVLLALKGERAAVELAEAAADLRNHHLDGEVISVRAHQLADPTSVVRLTRS